MMTQKQETPKVREFEWFEVEARVRELMGQLLQPFSQRQTEESTKVSELRRSLLALTRKTQEHSFLLCRQNAQKPAYFQAQDVKIEQNCEAMQSLKQLTETKLSQMEAVVQLYEAKVKQLNLLERRVDEQISGRTNEAKQLHEGLSRTVELLTHRIDAQIQEMRVVSSSMKTAVSKVETKMVAFDNRLSRSEDDQKHTNSSLHLITTELSQLTEAVRKIELQTDDLRQRVEDREKEIKLSQKFKAKLREVQNDLQFLTGYLHQHQPLRTQMQIADTLAACVHPRQRKLLCAYEEQTFSALHENILNGSRPSLEDLSSDFTSGLARIINRNRQFMTELALSNSRDKPMVEDKEGRESGKAKELQQGDILRVFAQEWSAKKDEMRKAVKEELKSSEDWLKELQEQMTLKSVQDDTKYEYLRKQIQQTNIKMDLQTKNTSQLIAADASKLTQLAHQTQQLKEALKEALNFTSLTNHLAIQDEIDRQSLALYAIRSKTNNEQQPPFHLDPNCANCDHKTTPIIQQAFKMACLTYNPSPIRIDEQSYSREEILQISTGILERFKRKLWGDFKEGSLKKSQNSMPSTHPTSTPYLETERKSQSTLKEGREGKQVRSKDIMLPLLGASKPERSSRKHHLSGLY